MSSDNIDDISNPEYVIPTFAPQGIYKLLWRGKKLGGIVTFVIETSTPTRVYFVLEISDHIPIFTGLVDVPMRVMSRSDLGEFISNEMEKMYIKCQTEEYEMEKKTGHIRIQ